MQRLRRAAPWMLGILTASLLFALLFAYATFQYKAGSEDVAILRSFMGFEGGSPALFSLSLHTFFAGLLWALSTLIPSVAWYSVLQLTLLWLSQVVIVKSLAQLSRRRGHTVWPGAFAGAVFLGAYAVFATCRISYAGTGAFAGAAAVAQLASVDFARVRPGGVTGPVAGSGLLLASAYSLGLEALSPALCFWLILLTVKLLVAFGRRGRPWRASRRVFAGVLITALLLGGCIGVRALNMRNYQAENLQHWQRERAQLFDTTDFAQTTTPATLAKIHWSAEELTLFTNGYFIDDTMTTAALHALNAQQTADDAKRTGLETLTQALQAMDAGLWAVPALQLGFLTVLTTALLTILLAAYRRERRVPLVVSVVLALLGSGLLLIYEARTGILPVHATVRVLYPLAAFLNCALFGAMAAPKRPATQPPGVNVESSLPAPDTGSPIGTAAAVPAHAKPRRAGLHRPNPLLLAPLLLTLLLTLGVSSAACHSMVTSLTLTAAQATGAFDENKLATLDAYAAAKPYSLFIYDQTSLTDNRLFPTLPQAPAGNTVPWGGYTAWSPDWLGALAHYGVTALNPALFIRANVLLATADPQPKAELLAHIAAFTGDTVSWTVFDTVGPVHLYRIFAY